jgi:Mg-chelatase subunit ChlD
LLDGVNALIPFLLAVTFVSPRQGTQAVGVMPIEVTTTAANVDRVEFFIDGVLAGVARKPPFRIAHDFGTSLAGHEISATVFSNGYRTAETAKVLTAALAASETMNVDLVEVPMRVRSPRPLRVDDLRLKENAVEQTIRDVRAERGAARFVFVVDRSLSMGDGKLAAALHAIESESKLLRPDDRVDVLLFNHNVMKAQPLSQVRDVEPSGGTSLRDALSSIASRERTYAIAITDGGDRNSTASEEEALRKISGTKMVVDAIVLGGGSRFLEKAAKNTGGVVAAASAATIARELRRILLDINSRYTLVYQSHGNAAGWRSIVITAKRKDVEVVNARKGYYAE